MSSYDMRVYPDTKIYIFCPDRLVTGGPEALHQLRWYMERLGYEAYIVYAMSGNTVCPPRYEKYAPRAVSWRDVEDSERNIIIANESDTTVLRHYSRLRRCIWFLSWNYSDRRRSKALIVCKNIVKFCIMAVTFGRKKYLYSRFPVFSRKGIVYLCGSEYAREQLQKKGVERAEMFVEPISIDFLKRGQAENLTSEGRSDVVLYNPAKPSRIMQKLLARTDISFRPLKGFTPDQLIDVYRASKLYIDFGAFGGPERIPKESVYNGTCLIVGKRNAAVNDFDIAIPGQFKMENYDDEEAVAAKIKEVLASYDACIGAFSHFREQIAGLEEGFLRSITAIFPRTEK